MKDTSNKGKVDSGCRNEFTTACQEIRLSISIIERFSVYISQGTSLAQLLLLRDFEVHASNRL